MAAVAVWMAVAGLCKADMDGGYGAYTGMGPSYGGGYRVGGGIGGVNYGIAEQQYLDPVTGLWMRNINNVWVVSPFQSIPETFYWAMATITTTGYGDAVPVSAAGKAIASITMIFGVLVSIVVAFTVFVHLFRLLRCQHLYWDQT